MTAAWSEVRKVRETGEAFPEAQLILACSRTRIDIDTADRILSLLQADLDWSYLFRQAYKNGVRPLVCWTLRQQFSDFLPPAILTEMTDYLRSHMRENLFQAGELIKIVRLFEAGGVAVLPFKGPSLAVMAYANLALRQFIDLDVLIQKKQLRRVEELLKSQGYTLTAPPEGFHRLFSGRRRKNVTFLRDDGGVVVEVHWQLSDPWFSLPFTPSLLWQGRESIELMGAPVRSLPVNDLLMYLCLHGSKHGWQRYEWVVDVAELIGAKREEMDWDGLLAQAARRGSERVVALGLFLAHELAGAYLPPGVLSWVNSDPAVTPLAARVKEWVFRDETVSLTTSEWCRYYLSLKEGQREKARLRLHYLHRYAQLALLPNEKDKDFIRLPAFLAFFYYLLRPIRLIKEYGLKKGLSAIAKLF